MPIMFAVKMVRLKVYKKNSQSDDLALHSRSQLRLKLDIFNLYYNVNSYLRQYLSYGIQTWLEGRLTHSIYAHAHFSYLDLDARSQWVGKSKNSVLNYPNKH